MLIDWQTVGFQIVNFLVLVWLLKRVLYGRIIEAMDAREALIGSRLAEADQDRDHATEVLRQLQADKQNWVQGEKMRISQSHEEAKQRRKDLGAEVRREVDEERQRFHEAVEKERRAFLTELRNRAAIQTCRVARKALADLANAQLEEAVLDAFLGRVREAGFANLAQGSIEVVSAWPLSDGQKERLGQAIADSRLSFDTSPELICGIELRADGQKLSWNVDNYLDALEENLTTALRVSGASGAERSEAPEHA